MSEGVSVRTEMSQTELENIRRAIIDGSFETTLRENEGATVTYLYEVPSGHIGLSVGLMPGDGDIHLSVSEWEREPHHELDSWIWTRSQHTGGDCDV